MSKNWLTFAFAVFTLVALSLTGCNKAAEAGDKAAGAAGDAAKTVANAAGDAAKAAGDAAADVVDNTPKTNLKFSETEHDFGKVVDGEKVRHTFKFTNTGDNPLIISNAKGSCGCTVPQWPKEPIASGATGNIEVEYNSKNKKGKQTKTVTITANTEPEKTFLKISAEVLPDPNAPAADATSQPQIKVN